MPTFNVKSKAVDGDKGVVTLQAVLQGPDTVTVDFSFTESGETYSETQHVDTLVTVPDRPYLSPVQNPLTIFEDAMSCNFSIVNLPSYITSENYNDYVSVTYDSTDVMSANMSYYNSNIFVSIMLNTEKTDDELTFTVTILDESEVV